MQKPRNFVQLFVKSGYTLKVQLLDYYKQYGIQEHTDGRHVVLIFPKGMKTIVQNACFPPHCKSGATQL